MQEWSYMKHSVVSDMIFCVQDVMKALKDSSTKGLIIFSSLYFRRKAETTILKHRTICSILMLCSEMIFFWSFRQSSSVRILVRACVQSAEKILIRENVVALRRNRIPDLQLCRSCLKNDFCTLISRRLFKWQYLRERHPKQEEIKDAQQFGSSALPHS